VPNERLRDAILRNGMTPTNVAEKIGVDPKTVERWITHADRVPFARHRHAIAALVRESHSYLWPNALSKERALAVAQSELVTIYPRRGAVPGDLWQRLLDQATMQIGILAYGGLFLHEMIPDLTKTLIAKAEAGAKVEVLIGDPNGQQVVQRGADEGIGESMPGKIRNTLAFYEPMRGHHTAGVMLHDTVLYNSIYRFDDDVGQQPPLRTPSGPRTGSAPSSTRRRGPLRHVRSELRTRSGSIPRRMARRGDNVPMARIEHYNDPNAPRANSIVVACTVFVTDDEDRVLLIRRTDNELWALPGGAQDIGEYIAETAVRETREESGVDIEVTGLVGIYSNPHHVVEYSDGEVRQQFSICFRARYVDGQPTPSRESSDVRWISHHDLDDLPIHPSMRLRIDHGYQRSAEPYVG